MLTQQLGVTDYRKRLERFNEQEPVPPAVHAARGDLEGRAVVAHRAVARSGSRHPEADRPRRPRRSQPTSTSSTSPGATTPASPSSEPSDDAQKPTTERDPAPDRRQGRAAGRPGEEDRRQAAQVAAQLDHAGGRLPGDKRERRARLLPRLERRHRGQRRRSLPGHDAHLPVPHPEGGRGSELRLRTRHDSPTSSSCWRSGTWSSRRRAASAAQPRGLRRRRDPAQRRGTALAG